MRLSSILALLIVGTTVPGAVRAGGFGPGLLPSGSLSLENPIRGSSAPTASLLATPTAMNPSSTRFIIETSAENLLRTREGDRLTADITTRGQAYSLFVPIKHRRGETVLALSRGTSKADVFYVDGELDSDLTWTGDTRQLAICQTLGSARLGFTSSRFRSTCDGESLYPSNVFRVFTGDVGARLSINSDSDSFQLAHPVGSGVVRLTAGSGKWEGSATFDQDDLQIVIPVRARMPRFGMQAETWISRHLLGSLGFEQSKGSSNDQVTLGIKSAGKIETRPSFTGYAASLRYQRRPDAAWELGFTSDARSASLIATGLRGYDLGINLKPFSEKVDIRAEMALKTKCAYIGLQRRVSPKWQVGARAKVARVTSPVTGSYLGRGFFGLVSVSGNFECNAVTTGLWGLELSATRTSGPATLDFRLQQVAPRPARGHHAPQLPGPPPVKSTSIGGTSASVTCSYAF